ncbi:MAG: hypothetical protein ABW007_00765 [Chitinophagaceae bacterium]
MLQLTQEVIIKIQGHLSFYQGYDAMGCFCQTFSLQQLQKIKQNVASAVILLGMCP